MGDGVIYNRKSNVAMGGCKYCCFSFLLSSIFIEVVIMILKVILFLAAVLNLIFTAVSIYLGKKDLSIALGILEIIIVFLWFNVGE